MPNPNNNRLKLSGICSRREICVFNKGIWISIRIKGYYPGQLWHLIKSRHRNRPGAWLPIPQAPSSVQWFFPLQIPFYKPPIFYLQRKLHSITSPFFQFAADIDYPARFIVEQCLIFVLGILTLTCSRFISVSYMQPVPLSGSFKKPASVR